MCVWRKLEFNKPEFSAQFKTEKKLNWTLTLIEVILSFSSERVKQHHPVEECAQVRSVGESVFTPTAAEAAAFAHFCGGNTSAGYF